MGHAARKLDRELELQEVNDEKRPGRAPVAVQVAADVVDESEVTSGVVTRLSEYGALVVTPLRAEVGTLIGLRLWLTDDAVVTTLAVVRGVSRDEGGASALVVELAGLENDVRACLREFMRLVRRGAWA